MAKKVQVIRPEDEDKHPIGKKVFLAGTIDDGISRDWQSASTFLMTKILSAAKDDTTFYNPRRRHWNPEASEEEIEKQIRWEIHKMDDSDIILMNFLPESKSPITLLELGHYVGKKKMIVACPKEFYRYTNVRVMCDIFGIELVHSEAEAMLALIQELCV